MADETEDEHVERENVELRKEMLRYALITDTEDKFELVLRLVRSKLLVPVIEDGSDPDDPYAYATMYEGEKGKQLFVYTSVLLIPEECGFTGASFVPFVNLLQHLEECGDVNVLRIDSGAEHGVGILLDKDGPQAFRLKRVEDYLAEQAGKAAGQV